MVVDLTDVCCLDFSFAGFHLLHSLQVINVRDSRHIGMRAHRFAQPFDNGMIVQVFCSKYGITYFFFIGYGSQKC